MAARCGRRIARWGRDRHAKRPDRALRRGIGARFGRETAAARGAAALACVAAGDGRIVFGRYEGKWVAVRYDYVDESIAPEGRVEFAWPLVTATAARGRHAADRGSADCRSMR